MRAVSTALVVLALSGCYGSSPDKVTLATPGEYKGRVDPLVVKLKPGGKLEQTLQARLKVADGRR